MAVLQFLNYFSVTGHSNFCLKGKLPFIFLGIMLFSFFFFFFKEKFLEVGFTGENDPLRLLMRPHEFFSQLHSFQPMALMLIN